MLGGFKRKRELVWVEHFDVLKCNICQYLGVFLQVVNIKVMCNEVVYPYKMCTMSDALQHPTTPLCCSESKSVSREQLFLKFVMKC